MTPPQQIFVTFLGRTEKVAPVAFVANSALGGVTYILAFGHQRERDEWKEQTNILLLELP